MKVCHNHSDAPSPVNLPRPKSELTEQMLSLKKGDHLCLFYDKDPLEQLPALVPFIQESLSQDEQFIYIADDQSVDALTERLTGHGINVGQESKRGRLKLWTRQDWRQPGRLDSEKKSRQVRQLVDESAAAGFKGTRFAVEMTWTLGPDISAARLEHWEAKINTIFVPGFPGRIVCQYNQSRLAPDALMAALHTHPLAILGEHVCPNLFYRAPLILDHSARPESPAARRSRSAATVQWMVSQLRRSRLQEKEREELIHQRVALAEAEAARLKTERILESITDGFIALDLNGQISYVNTNAAHFLGGGQDSLPGRNLWKEFPQLAGGCFYQECRRAAAEGQAVTFEEFYPHWRTWMEARIFPSTEGLSIYFRDITARKRTEEALRETKEQLSRSNERLEKRVRERTAELSASNSQLEAFVYSIAHDLRAPLRSMQAFSTMLLEDYAAQLDDTAKNYAGRIVRSAETMDRLVLDLLAYGRVARVDMSMAKVNVESSWNAAMSQNERVIAEREALIEVISPLPQVLAHEATLGQVLANVLSNALKFVPPEVTPRVRFWSEDRPDAIRLWIQDNGIGIAKEHHERVFRVFERLNDKQFDGTGIGLSIVRKGVERMGGRVGLESQLGDGTRIWLDLPKALGSAPIPS